MAERNWASILRVLWSAISSKNDGGRTHALAIIRPFVLRPKMGEKKSIWLRWRLFAHKHNNRLLYAMMGLMFSAQMIMVYKHLKGERVVREYTV